MTVEREPSKADDAVHCVWLDLNGQPQRAELPRRTLDKVRT
jgi:hypothetical protein